MLRKLNNTLAFFWIRNMDQGFLKGYPIPTPKQCTKNRVLDQLAQFTWMHPTNTNDTHVLRDVMYVTKLLSIVLGDPLYGFRRTNRTHKTLKPRTLVHHAPFSLHHFVSEWRGVMAMELSHNNISFMLNLPNKTTLKKHLAKYAKGLL